MSMGTKVETGYMVNPLSEKELFYRVFNKIPAETSSLAPIVALHGLMGYLNNWGKVWPHFQSERPFMAYDQARTRKKPKAQYGLCSRRICQ